ncbi:hypothetical protein BTVI_43879 [Pitangus sulphuratus]|nr:hypothetical protein BTVI_43879 [Pitangus sulphuratus]
MEDTMAEIGTQTTTTTVIAPVMKKKKWMRQATGPYQQLVREEEEEEDEGEGVEGGDEADKKAGPSTKEVRQIKQETEVTQSLTSSELRDLRKDYSHQPSERIPTWLLQCWDNGDDSQQLEGHEVLARDHEIERGPLLPQSEGKEAPSTGHMVNSGSFCITRGKT